MAAAEILATLGAAALSAGGAIGSSQLANAKSRANMRLANKLNIENWEMQNEYNSPKNQMQRYYDAGLNPNLVYGNGSSSAGNAGSVSSVAAPRADFSLGNPGSAALDAYIQARQLRQSVAESNSRIAKNNADTNLVNSAKLDNILASTDKLKAELPLVNQQTANALQLGEQTKANVRKLQWEVEKGKDIYPYQRDYQIGLNKKILNDITFTQGKIGLLRLDSALKQVMIENQSLNTQLIGQNVVGQNLKNRMLGGQIYGQDISNAGNLMGLKRKALDATRATLGLGPTSNPLNLLGDMLGHFYGWTSKLRK